MVCMAVSATVLCLAACGKANYEVRFGHYAAAYFAADVFGDIGHYPGILRIVPVICGTPGILLV